MSPLRRGFFPVTSPSTKAVLRYRLITRSGRTVTDLDRKCFVTTASAPASQNGGTRCVSGVPPARQKYLVRLRPTPGCLLLFCCRFAIHLLPKMPFGLPVATLLLLLCYLFATHLLLNCHHSLFAHHHQGTLAMYTSPRRRGAPSESRSSRHVARLR